MKRNRKKKFIFLSFVLFFYFIFEFFFFNILNLFSVDFLIGFSFFFLIFFIYRFGRLSIRRELRKLTLNFHILMFKFLTIIVDLYYLVFDCIYTFVDLLHHDFYLFTVGMHYFSRKFLNLNIYLTINYLVHFYVKILNIIDSIRTDKILLFLPSEVIEQMGPEYYIMNDFDLSDDFGAYTDFLYDDEEEVRWNQFIYLDFFFDFFNPITPYSSEFLIT